MAIGFRQSDPSTGAVLVDITTRLPRIMGRAVVQVGVSGSVVVPVSGSNPIFYYYVSTNVPGREAASPTISVNELTSTISWTYPGSTYYASGVIVYGRY